MSMPGFFAEASLFRTSEHYRMSSVQNALARQSTVFPQQIAKAECIALFRLCLRECGGDPICISLCESDVAECLHYGRG